jgi:hypothetical protein
MLADLQRTILVAGGRVFFSDLTGVISEEQRMLPQVPPFTENARLAPPL